MILVSIIMSVYNEELYIAEAIDSVLAQTYSNFELIIINDGSTDKTAAIIQSYQDKRIRFFNDGLNKNQAVRANEGIALAKGKYIARLDGDDVCLPTRLEKQVSFLETHPEIAIVGTQIIIDDEHSNQMYQGKTLPVESDILNVYCLFFCPFIHSSIMVRRTVFDQFQYDESYILVQDYEWYSRVLNQYKGANLPDFLIRYRLHPQNVHRKNSLLLLQFVEQVIRGQFSQKGITLSNNDLKNILLFSESNKDILSRNELTELGDWIKDFFDRREVIRQIPNSFRNQIIAFIWKEIYWKTTSKDSLLLTRFVLQTIGLNQASLWICLRSIKLYLMHL